MIVTGCGSKEPKLIGEYTQSIDLTDYAKNQAREWLSVAYLSNEIELEQYINDISVSANVSIYNNESYSVSIVAESYDEAYDKAKIGLGEALTELISIRAEKLGKDPMDAEAVNSLMLQKTDFSMQEYIETYGPELLPSQEKLRSMYDITGSYALEGDK